MISKPPARAEVEVSPRGAARVPRRPSSIALASTTGDAAPGSSPVVGTTAAGSSPVMGAAVLGTLPLTGTAAVGSHHATDAMSCAAPSAATERPATDGGRGTRGRVLVPGVSGRAGRVSSPGVGCELGPAPASTSSLSSMAAAGNGLEEAGLEFQSVAKAHAERGFPPRALEGDIPPGGHVRTPTTLVFTAAQPAVQEAPDGQPGKGPDPSSEPGEAAGACQTPAERTPPPRAVEGGDRAGGRARKSAPLVFTPATHGRDPDPGADPTPNPKPGASTPQGSGHACDVRPGYLGGLGPPASRAGPNAFGLLLGSGSPAVSNGGSSKAGSPQQSQGSGSVGLARAQWGSPAGATTGLAAATAFPGGRVRDAVPSPKPEPFRPAAIAAFWRCADMFAKYE